MTTRGRSKCPHCGAPTEGLGTFCWSCGRYTDENDPEPFPEEPAPVNNAVDYAQDYTEPKSIPRKRKRKASALPAPLEVDIRTAAVQYLRARGFAVWDLEQGFRPFNCKHCGGKIGGGSRQTLGLPDGYVVGFGVRAWIEYKRPGEEQTDEQKEFEEAVTLAGGIYLLAFSAEDVHEWVESLGPLAG